MSPVGQDCRAPGKKGEGGPGGRLDNWKDGPFPKSTSMAGVEGRWLWQVSEGALVIAGQSLTQCSASILFNPQRKCILRGDLNSTGSH